MFMTHALRRQGKKTRRAAPLRCSPGFNCRIEVQMIKSVVVPTFVGQDQSFDELRAVFTELGFRHGEGWDDDLSRGAPFLAPLGGLEVIQGEPPARADILVEVLDLDRVRSVVEKHGLTIADAPHDTHWNSRLFVVELPNGFRVAFFEYAAQKAS